MRAKIVFAVFFYTVLGFAAFFCSADEVPASDGSQKVIGIDQILFPSMFITATEDDFMISAYMRTRLKEGDFPTDLQEEFDSAERFLHIRLGRWGVTFGWLEDKSRELMEPYILAADYKFPIMETENSTALAADFKISTGKLPESSLRQSVLSFGVFSASILASKRMAAIFEPYGGVTMNYVYLDAAEKDITDLWKMVPFAGLRIDPGFHSTQLAFELNRGRVDASEEPVLCWHLGVSIKF